ncbi:glycosyltransferase [Latilactobacillus fuchuensis]|uniref:glycosyltransferase n=1 Tax=Latilactobacillus fuchuensis TaxID=164393 RepID=UPI0039AF5626
MQQTISFIMPIYGTEIEIFKQGLNRFQRFSATDYEFVLVSDGAAEELVEVCQQFVKLDSRFKLVEQDNQGVSAARNKGIEKARGDWIAFVDPDDLVATDFVEQVTPFLEVDVDIIFGGFDRFYNHDSVEKTFTIDQLFTNTAVTSDQLIKATLSDGDYYQGIYGYYLGTPWAKLFRRRFLLDNRLRYPVGVIKREDSLFSIEAFLKQPKVSVIDAVIYHYRIDHDNSISNNYSQQVKGSFQQVFRQLQGDLKHWLTSDHENYQIYATYCLRLTIELLFVDFCNPTNQQEYTVRKHEFLEYTQQPEIKELIKAAKLTNMPVKQKVLGILIKTHQFRVLDRLLKRNKE